MLQIHSPPPKPNPDPCLPLLSLSRAFGFPSHLSHLRRSFGFLHARSQVPPPTRERAASPPHHLLHATDQIPPRRSLPLNPRAPRLPPSSPHLRIASLSPRHIPTSPLSALVASPRSVAIAVLDASSLSTGFLAAVPQIDPSSFSLRRQVPFAVRSSTVVQSAAHHVAVQSLSSSPLRRALLHRRPVRRPQRRSLSLNSDARSLGSPPPPPSSPPTPTHPPRPSPKGSIYQDGGT